MTGPRGPWRIVGQLRDVAGRAVLAFWVGSLWTIGYVVAPALFASLDDRALAGSIAGTLFHIEARISLVCGPVLLLLLWLVRREVHGSRPDSGPRSGPRLGNRRCTWLVGLMLALVVASEWVVGPVLADASRGTREFAVLHGVSALLYLATSVAGLALLLAWGPLRSAE